VTRAFVALGSNLGDRWAHLRAAVEGLPDVVAVSPVYETDPVGGPGGQGAYLNAVVELETALSAFERLGAIHEIHRVRSMLHASQRTRATPTLMFTDIVESTKLVELLGDEAWSNLLDWHDRTLRECFSTTAGREIGHEGDGFFISFADPLAATSCAVAIQRTLAAHRRDHGFAPEVRIGIHATEAIDLGDDYHGKGVHEAARIAAAAGAGEILVTRSVLDDLDGQYSSHDTRQLQMKGLVAPAEVSSIDWQLPR